MVFPFSSRLRVSLLLMAGALIAANFVLSLDQPTEKGSLQLVAEFNTPQWEWNDEQQSPKAKLSADGKSWNVEGENVTKLENYRLAHLKELQDSWPPLSLLIDLETEQRFGHAIKSLAKAAKEGECDPSVRLPEPGGAARWRIKRYHENGKMVPCELR